MIGQAATIIRERPDQRRTYTSKGIIRDVNTDDDGNVTGVLLDGVRVEDGTAMRSWYAVGPHGLDGSLVTEQHATLDACGHGIADGCDCGTIRAEADAT